MQFLSTLAQFSAKHIFNNFYQHENTKINGLQHKPKNNDCFMFFFFLKRIKVPGHYDQVN